MARYRWGCARAESHRLIVDSARQCRQERSFRSMCDQVVTLMTRVAHKIHSFEGAQQIQ